MKRVEHSITIDCEGNRTVARIDYEDGEIHFGAAFTEEGRTVERIEYPSGVKEYGLKQRKGEYPTCERVEYPNGSVEYNVVYADGFRRIGRTVFADGDVHHDVTVKDNGAVTIGRAEISDAPEVDAAAAETSGASEENTAAAERPEAGKFLH